MSPWIVLLVAAAYAALLFWVAHEGDGPDTAHFADRHQRVIYGLGLAVYCTSWTFYGAVGTAVESGWRFLPIYLGPILVFVLFGRFVERMLQTAKAQHSTSIADFLSARYGKSAWVAALVTIIALFGALPYMALQLKSVSQTLTALAPALSDTVIGAQVPLLVAGAMAAFAILFGTGRPELTAHNRGLALAIALEALVKFIALGAVAAFAVLLLSDGVPLQVVANQASRSFVPGQLDARFVIMTVLSAIAILCLPRQFHMLVVEARSDRVAGVARWLLPVYLIMVSAAVIPVMLAGQMLAPPGIAPDMLMIGLPLALDMQWLAVLAFIGGLSASTGMIIVTGLAVSNMVTNDLLVPAFFRDQMRHGGHHGPVGQVLINMRRLTIVVLMLLAYLFVRSLAHEATLAGLGELAFAGVAQFAPGLFLGYVWRRANRTGMIAGLLAGFALWLVLLALPVFGLDIRPFTVGGDPLVSGVLLSLAANFMFFVIFSLAGETTLVDRVQAVAFVDRGQPDLGRMHLSTQTRVADFRLLLEQFAGRERAREAINEVRLATARNYRDADPVDDALIGKTEQIISSIIGASSARALVQSTLEGDPVSIEQVVAMFDETSQRLQFGVDVLQVAIENIDQGVSVVDDQQRLVAWNGRYVEMFDFPDELIAVGQSVADLLRFNLRQMGVREEAVDREVAKRIGHLRAGTRYSTERELADGRILRIVGTPVPNGGYVSSYNDVTADRQAEQALEAKVLERTEQLVEANAALAAATQSKTRFLAAASHDLVQPMNAARLFASALGEEIGESRGSERALLDQIDRSIETADRLLRALLDISRLDGGRARVEPARFALDRAFEEIANEFEVQVEVKGLQFSVRRCGLWVETDRGLLISVLQNLVTNAVRYSDAGRILVGGRRRGDDVEIFVADQGRGIAPEDAERVFHEFTRVGDHRDDKGLGLGLAIVRRIAEILGTEVTLRSEPGRGSCFRLRIPCVEAAAADVAPAAPVHSAGHGESRRVLCIDDDQSGLAGLTALLERWGFDVTGLSDPALAATVATPDLVIVDYRLAEGLTGEGVYRMLCDRWSARPPVILLTAEDTVQTKAAAEEIDARRLVKPPAPASLRALVEAMLN